MFGDRDGERRHEQNRGRPGFVPRRGTSPPFESGSLPASRQSSHRSSQTRLRRWHRQVAGTPAGVRENKSEFSRWCRKHRSTTGYRLRSLRDQDSIDRSIHPFIHPFILSFSGVQTPAAHGSVRDDVHRHDHRTSSRTGKFRFLSFLLGKRSTFILMPRTRGRAENTGRLTRSNTIAQ